MADTAHVRYSFRSASKHVSFATIPIHLHKSGVSQGLRLPPLAEDLLEVAAVTLLADRLFVRPRGGTAPREIVITMTVREPRAWRRADHLLTSIQDVLSGDVFRYEFYRRNSQRTRLGKSHRAECELNAQHVVLFSGGLDSSCAAAMFAREGRDAAYVTSYVNGRRAVASLLDSIHERFAPGVKPLHALYRMTPDQALSGRLREHSRRTRSFYFASLGLATAIGTGARDVNICENGPLAINLPLNESMRPTRHAHSLFLEAMSELSGSLFKREVPFRNPFELQTKGEMARVFADNPDLAFRTISCWNQQWSGSSGAYSRGHCGFCFPCLVRCVALHSAGFHIPPGHFDVEPRSQLRKGRASEGRQKHNSQLRDLMEFAETVGSCRTWQQMVQRFPAIIDTGPTVHASEPRSWYAAVFRMMQRFSREVELTYGAG